MDAQSERVDISVLLNNLANTKSDDEIHNALMDLNMILEAKREAREQLSRVDLSHFLKQLNSLAGKAKAVGISLLGKVFSVLDPIETVSKYVVNFTEGLGTDCEEMKIMYLNQLEIVSSNSKGVEFLKQNFANCERPVIVYVAENIAHNSIGVAKLAANVIKNVCIAFDAILTEGFMSVFVRHLNRGSVIRFRVYELFVHVFLSKSEILENSYVVRIFKQLNNEMNTTDILSQLNCLDILSEMACKSSVGLQFISNHGTLDRVNNIFRLAESDPLQGMLIPGAVKFFGSIAIMKPLEILENYQQFLQFVFANLDSDDASLAALCFETIANICTSEDGMRFLCSSQKQMNNAMKIAGRHMQSPFDESIKVRILESLSIIFKSGHPIASMSLEKEKLYRNISKNPLEMLMETAKKPFPAMRHAALAVLSHLAKYIWIEEDMALTPGFLEYLLDRRTEPDKEGKELKYSIIKSLSMSKTAKDNLGLEYYQRISQYAREGPFRSDQETAVDFEEAN